MIIQVIKHTISRILNHKIDSLANILGLTIGIGSFIIIASYIAFEYSYDTCYANSDNIYRIVTDVPQKNGSVMNTAMSSGMFSRTVEEHFDEIIASTRIMKSFNTLFTINEKSVFEKNLWFADSSFFKVFNFDFLVGNPDDVLNGNSKVVISESAAKKYFGNINPINKNITISNRWNYTVSGIFKDLPSNMHLKIDALATPDSIIPSFTRNNWGAFGLFNYILVSKNTNPDTLTKRFHLFSIDHMGENWANLVQFKLQSVRDIHLYSDRLHEVANTMDVKQLKYLSGISLLILLMAGLNFMNIYSARAEYRSKEVGLKKLFGAKRFNLIFQFLSESILYTLISILISISIIIFLNSFLENLTQSQFKLEFNNTILILVIILIFIGVISGLYPAIYLSSFKPLNTIKGIFRSKKSGSSLRKVLTIIQLSLALFMIFATFVVYMQMKYIRNKDLGFDHANLLSLSLNTRDLFNRNKMLKDEFNKFSGVKDICFSSSRIDNILAGQRSYVLKDSSSSENKMDYMIRTIFVDENYIPLYDIKMNDGRNFSLEYPTDIDNSIIINESGAKLLGLSNPVGKQVISYYNDSNYVFNIIGVMKDFNYQSLHTPIEPLFFRFRDNNFSVMTIKTSDKEIQETVKFSDNKMNELSPDYPISTEILSDEINTHYDKEKRISTIYQLLTFLSIFIACLGLFGIISFILEKKTKETGIKKVLGASNRDLFFSLSKDLLLWLSFAAIVSFPMGYYIMEKWLDRFAYKTTLYWWLFPLSFLLIFLVSFMTTSYKTLKAIRSNPIDSLRYE